MKIITMGDSIMQYNDYTTYPQSGWVQMLDRFFDRSVEFVNLARNGRSTKSFIAEGRFELVKSVISPGDYVIIQFAHNDEKIQDPARYTSPDEGGEFMANLCFFIDEIRSKQGIPVLLTPVARRKFNEDGILEDTHGKYVDAVLKVCRLKNLPEIDITSLTMKKVQSLGVEKSKKLYLNFNGGEYENFPQGKDDNSHLRGDGAYEVSRITALELSHISDSYPEYSPLKSALIIRQIDRAALDREISDEKAMA